MIREAHRSTDLEKLVKLRRQLNDVHRIKRPDMFTDTSDFIVTKDTADMLLSSGKVVLVDTVGNDIAAFAVLTLVNSAGHTFMKKLKSVRISEFCVDIGYRHRGVGTELMNYIIYEWMPDHGYKRADLNVWQFNKEAESFYSKFGFKVYQSQLEIKLK